MSPVPLWSRPRHRPSGRHAQVRLFAFASVPLSLEGGFDPEEYGAPSPEALTAVETSLNTRAEDPTWFDRFETIAIGSRPSTELESCSVVYRIQVSLEDPRDLGHLQSAWAVARWLCRAGCTAVLDGDAIVWHASADVLGMSPTRPFDRWREICLVSETEACHGVGHMLHSRGMVKLRGPTW